MKIILISLLLCCPALRAMEKSNNYNFPPRILEAPSAPPAYDSDDDSSHDGEHRDQATEHRLQYQSSLQALKELRAKMKKDRMMLHVSFKNKSGSDFLSKSMSYDINDDGTCPPTNGWEVISFKNANGLSSNPLPLNYEKPLDDEAIQATGWYNFQRMMVAKRVYSRVSEEQKEREKTTYTTCFQPLSISLDQKTVKLLVSLTKIVDGQHSLVVPKTTCIVPLYMKYAEPYTQQFNPADTEPITLEIKTSVYN